MFVCLFVVCLFLFLSYFVLSFLFPCFFLSIIFPSRFFCAGAYIPRATAMTIPHFNQVISPFNLSKLDQPPMMQVKQVLRI